jgi:hypothetical protein
VNPLLVNVVAYAKICRRSNPGHLLVQDDLSTDPRGAEIGEGEEAEEGAVKDWWEKTPTGL